MVRKRSIASVLDDDHTPTTNPPRITIRSVVQPRRNRMEVCICNNCKGSLVESRTKRNHELLEQTSEDVSTDNNRVATLSETSEILENPLIQENVNDDISQSSILNKQKIDELQQANFLPRKCSLRYIPVRVPVSGFRQQEDQIDKASSSENDYESAQSNIAEEDQENDDESEFNEINISEIFEDYSCPSFESSREPNVALPSNEFLWILLWIMKFRIRFNISETATESLIKFMRLLLKEIDDNTFKDFPGTLHKARKFLGLKDQFHSFAACPNCHKLYNEQEVTEFCEDGTPAIMKCQHIEFPNSSRRSICRTPLSHQTRSLNKVSNHSEMIYPVSMIHQQLATLYLRTGFENSLRHWINRSDSNNLLTDIYDGQIWKMFKETSGRNFFRPEVADSNLGLMLNLDWF